MNVLAALLLPGLLAPAPRDDIKVLDPPLQGFYSKQLDDDGIPILAHKDVADEALVEARRRLRMMMEHQPNIHWNLAKAGANLHIIGKNQVTSDLPEYWRLKGKPFDGKLTVDERTRGLGGLSTSCGEENLLKLENDRYKGRDICVHEFAHNIYRYGVPATIREKFREQMRKSTAKGLWVGSYAATNEDEFFAELTMWYFGTHGDLHMQGTKPENGREGLRKCDPDALSVFDELYAGKMAIPRQERPKSRG